MIKSYEKSNIIVKSKVYPETLWLKRLLNIGLLICSVWLITIIFSILNENYKNQIFYPMWICISFLIYWIGYIGLAKSKLLIERKKLKANKKRETKIKKSINSNSTFNKIETKIITEQLYLNPNLNLSLLSNLLGLSEGYISQQINTNSEINFNDYINKLRINNAKETLTNKDFNNYTIESIGLESGFNSKSSFYAAFKKFTNQTPVQYKKDVRNL
ncbi:helix-turn-helix domain-containing protein [Olleya sp. UBA1516]|uniref:helix-turn-helix domain-containing protein n=1 Tax=Olleya sp. UBA1516 TaxID=1947013 RepID=UPI0025EDC2CD|nr:helix-turn-helix domain-containing protein [Olleya sp. UBA1516]